MGDSDDTAVGGWQVPGPTVLPRELSSPPLPPAPQSRTSGARRAETPPCPGIPQERGHRRSPRRGDRPCRLGGSWKHSGTCRRDRVRPEQRMPPPPPPGPVSGGRAVRMGFNF